MQGLRGRRLVRMALALVLAVTGLSVTTSVVSAPSAMADACYTWNRTLQAGTSGSDVKELQIRVAG